MRPRVHADYGELNPAPRIVNAADFGFSEENTGEQNRAALQRAIDSLAPDDRERDCQPARFSEGA